MLNVEPSSTEPIRVVGRSAYDRLVLSGGISVDVLLATSRQDALGGRGMLTTLNTTVGPYRLSRHDELWAALTAGGQSTVSLAISELPPGA